MFARLSAFVVWALVAAAAVAWGLKLTASPLSAPPQTVVAAPSAAPGGDWSRLFGAAPPPPAELAAADAPPPPPESSRFQLIGVVAPKSSSAVSQGVALIAVDGKTPRAYRVGAVIDGDQVLRAVQQRAVSIGPRRGEPTLTLELPPLPPPATGVPGSPNAAGPSPVAPVIGMPGRVVVPVQPMPPQQPPVAPMPGPTMSPVLSQTPRSRAAAVPGGMPAEAEADEAAPSSPDPRRQR